MYDKSIWGDRRPSSVRFDDPTRKLTDIPKNIKRRLVRHNLDNLIGYNRLDCLLNNDRLLLDVIDNIDGYLDERRKWLKCSKDRFIYIPSLTEFEGRIDVSGDELSKHTIKGPKLQYRTIYGNVIRNDLDVLKFNNLGRVRLNFNLVYSFLMDDEELLDVASKHILNCPAIKESILHQLVHFYNYNNFTERFNRKREEHSNQFNKLIWRYRDHKKFNKLIDGGCIPVRLFDFYCAFTDDASPKEFVLKGPFRTNVMRFALHTQYKLLWWMITRLNLPGESNRYIYKPAKIKPTIILWDPDKDRLKMILIKYLRWARWDIEPTYGDGYRFFLDVWDNRKWGPWRTYGWQQDEEGKYTYKDMEKYYEEMKEYEGIDYPSKNYY